MKNKSLKALFDAIAAHDYDAARDRLSQNPDINAIDPVTGRTALGAAAASGDADMVHLLLEAGADPLAPDAQGLSAISHAESRLMLQAGDDDPLEDKTMKNYVMATFPLVGEDFVNNEIETQRTLTLLRRAAGKPTVLGPS